MQPVNSDGRPREEYLSDYDWGVKTGFWVPDPNVKVCNKGEHLVFIDILMELVVGRRKPKRKRNGETKARRRP